MEATRKRKARDSETSTERGQRQANAKVRERLARKEKREANTKRRLLSATERIGSVESVSRAEETRLRNSINQLKATQLKADGRKARSKRRLFSYASRQSKDRHAFYEAIDEPIAFICGSCGELANARTMKVVEYDPQNAWFKLLRGNELPVNGLVPEAIVKHSTSQSVPFCDPCMTCLKRNQKPKFCAASGFFIRNVPNELEILNNVESRMVGLGVCFTTCYNLAGDGQECSRGNAINFWNDACAIAVSLPRPLTKCGVIHLRNKGESDPSRVYSVRPNLIRAALLWLRENNSLYQHIEISEDVLQDLESTQSLPELHIDTNVRGLDSTSESDVRVVDDVTSCDELFHMVTGDQSARTESDKILETLTVDVEGPSIAINEHSTQMMMQYCFPTLFPDGRGGIHPLSEEYRAYSYDLAAYCAHLMAWHDRRFVVHRNFKFFCLNLIQRRQIDGLTRRIQPRDATLSEWHGLTQDGKNANVDQRTRHILKELKPYFKVVRGSGLYWSDVRDQLMALLGNDVLPTPFPTFFFTLSAADTIWPDFFCACDSRLTVAEAACLSSKERRRYLNENPDIASRHFNRRFRAFFDHILCGDAKPLGEICDFFWRVEFQKRGSPHIHGLLWVKDAPDVLKLSETVEGRHELASFVDRFISADNLPMSATPTCQCQLCTRMRDDPNLDILTFRPTEINGANDDEDIDEHSKCDLARTVRRVQQHVCFVNSSCRAKTGACRFEFPKQVLSNTAISVEKSDNGALKLHVNLRRTDSATNNYNPDMLSVWRANMDIKLVGNAYGAAEYTAAYVSKAEPDTTRFRSLINTALSKCTPGSEYHDVLRRVANATLSAREVSAQEALWILQNGLPMYGKSRNVLNVKTTRHSKRFYRIDPTSVRQEIIGSTKESPGVRIDLLEAAYMARPNEFNEMSYRTFCENFEPTKDEPTARQTLQRWARLDGRGYIKARRSSQAIAKLPRWKADADDADYCFSEVFLRVPWRQLSELPEDDDSCRDRFQKLKASTEVNTRIRLEDSLCRQRQLQLLSDSREASTIHLPTPEWEFVGIDGVVGIDGHKNAATETRAAQAQSQPVSLGTYSLEDVSRAETFIAAVVRPFMKARREKSPIDRNGNTTGTKPYMYPIGLDSENMNFDQWKAFALCMKQSRQRLRAHVTSENCKPMTVIVNGEGGSGKSWLIRHIVKDIHNVFGEISISTRHSKRVLLLAHHGTAAFNIKGVTICSALSLPRMTGKGYEKQYEPLSETRSGATKLRKLQDSYATVHMVILDEYSVVSCAMLNWIDHRMREIWPSCRNVPFGGRDCILVGDLGQLNPVMPAALYTPLDELENNNQREGRRRWLEMEHVCNLTSQNRGQDDPIWYAALSRLRRMEHTQMDFDLFNTRFPPPITFSPSTNFIAYKNEDVDRANQQFIEQQPNPVYTINAKHVIESVDKIADVSARIDANEASNLLAQAVLPNRNRDRILRPTLALAIGAPVCLTYNLEQSAGLCNGTKCIVHDFILKPDNDLPIVLVQVVDKYIGPSFLEHLPNIVPITAHKLSWTTGRTKLRTRRTGLPLRLAYAMTIHKIQGLTCSSLVFDPSGIPSSAFAYVGLSRVRHRDHLSLSRELLWKPSSDQSRIKQNLTKEWARLDAVDSTQSTSDISGIAMYQAIASCENSGRRLKGKNEEEQPKFICGTETIV